ncbi:MAG: hypothetical protein A4E28_02499 [Methanocella sp. PtaU1.Bin125]|nr:MAG: hypothetical protein A4E28_02499 [Methanocella sp. PtaU1.Bin125]
MIPRALLDHINANYRESLGDLLDFLRIPGVGADPAHASDVRKSAAWLLGYLTRIGLDARLYETPGFPVIFAQYGKTPEAPTLLLYAHYDVAPPGPPEEWTVSPFIPVVRGGLIFARGAVDDRGQLFSVLQAIACTISVDGGLPVNVKLLLEGEEEIGSPGLGAFIREHKGLLCADIVVVVDILKYRSDMPAAYYGSKGLLSVTVDVSGPSVSLHSGIYGGDIVNPADVLVRILGSLKNADGRILVPGFYDRVREVTPEERSDFAALPFDRDGIKAMLGVEPVAQEEGYTPLECVMARPTLSVNGLWGGALPGAPLMIIPASAGALVSFRLVPDQRPDEIYRLLKAHVDSLIPPGIGVNLHIDSCHEPFVTSRDSIAVVIVSRALEAAFGQRPVLVRSGGTSGIVPMLKKAVGVQDIVITGWGDPGDGEHSSDEHFSIENYRRGIVATAAIMYELAIIKGETPAR